MTSESPDLPALPPALYFACDHAGYPLKVALQDYLRERYGEAAALQDLGTHGTDAVDYPDFGHVAATRVRDHPGSLGVITCGSGVGISIAANRVAGARAALCHTPELAQLAREHNDANILALGARIISEMQARACLLRFLATPFAGGRHQARVAKLG